MATLNQIIQSIKQYFEYHAMINTTNITLDDSDLNAFTDIVYPVANIQYIDTNVTDTLMNHNFIITIGDLTNPNVELIDIEIFSDCIQIAGDFFGWLDERYEEDGGVQYDWGQSTNIQQFSDSFKDRVSGIKFRITLSSRRAINSNCIAPWD